MMIKLKNLLTEVQWEGDIADKITKNEIPLTPKMINRVFSKKKFRAIHVSNWYHFKALHKIQNSKKSISVATNWVPRFIDSGVWGGSGFTSVLEGELLVGNDDDIMSTPDKQGRRWISLDYLKRSGGKDLSKDSFKMTNEIEQMKKKLYEKNLKKYNAWQQHNNLSPTKGANFRGALYIRGLANIFQVNSLHSDDSLEKGDSDKIIIGAKFKKMKQEIIKDYMIEMEKLLIKNKKFMETFRDFSYEIPGGWTNWNESVMANFEIIQVYIDDDHPESPVGEEFEEEMSKLNVEFSIGSASEINKEAHALVDEFNRK